MNIHENTALLDAFADGALTADERTAVQAHLEVCPECRGYVDDLLTIRAAFPTENDAVLPADFTKKVMDAVAGAPQSRPKKQPWGKLLTAAACLAVIVLVQRGVSGGNAENASATASYSTADCMVEENAAVERSVDTSAAAEDVDAPAETAPTEGESGLFDTAGGYTAAAPAAKSSDAPTATESDDAETEPLPTVRLSEAEIGELLSDREPDEIAPGCVRYLLTRAEFDALTAQLADPGIPLTDDSDSEQLWLEIFEE